MTDAHREQARPVGERWWWRTLSIIFGFAPCVAVGNESSVLTGYAFFMDERAWPLAITTALDAVLLFGTGLSLVFWFFGTARSQVRERALARWMLLGGALVLALGPLVFVWLPPTVESRQSFAMQIMALHVCVAPWLLVNGWWALRRSRATPPAVAPA